MPNLKVVDIICDPEDKVRILSQPWQFDPDGRVRANINSKTVRLHQFVMPGHAMLDHKNGNQLDVRKENLRPATTAQNGWNRGKTSVNTSGYKGVFRRKDLMTKPWLAKITVNSKQINLGRFSNKEDAARAYDTAARKYHGEFAVTNFSDRQEDIES